MQLNKVLSVTFGCLILVLTNVALANSIEELKQNGKLQIKTWIEPQENIVARQQVNLLIEVATDRWFSSGTRIRHFEIDGAIVLQRDNFAVNSTLRLDDATWTVQMWTLVIYPQRSGVFEIPAIPLALSIAGEDSQAIVGELYTRPFSFVASIPEPMQDRDGWVATNRFSVSESFDKSFESLKPGDALTRTIKVSADNLPSMMLPGFFSPGVSGMAVYKKPVRLGDKVNRGDYLAERTEEITYVFEKAGDYELPGQRFFWWNLSSQSLESLQLEARTVSVIGAAMVVNAGAEPQAIAEEENALDFLALLKKAVTVLAILVLVLIAVRKRLQAKAPRVAVKQPPVSASALRTSFAKACRRQNYEKALGLLYQWLDRFGGDSLADDSFSGSLRVQLERIDQPELLNAFNDVMCRMYGKNDYNDVDLQQFAKHYINATIHTTTNAKTNLRRIYGLANLPIDLKLN